VTVSGYDQAIDNYEEDQPAPVVAKPLHPRHDGTLAQLLTRAAALGDVRQLVELVRYARWARGSEANTALASLAVHPDDSLRHAVIDALGWRLRKRDGDPAPLVKALSHRDPQTQFLAAEGLARGQRADGVSILLSSIEFQPDLLLRRRAVQALGLLADERALAPLWKLATEDGHALQDEAVEALGHLGRTEKADDIARLLLRCARGTGSVAERALRGLRWLGQSEGWQLLRQQALSSPAYRITAIDQLGYHDDPANRDLLLRLLTTEAVPPFLSAALASARRLWGSDQAPLMALIQNPRAGTTPFGAEALQTICDHGDARQMFAVLPKCSPDTQQALATSLLNREPPPLAEAEAALDSPSERTAQLAARLVGRSANPKQSAVLTTALSKWLKAWDASRQKAGQSAPELSRLTDALTPCVTAFLWAAGRLGAGVDLLKAAVAAHPDDRLYRPVREAAVSALTSLPSSEPMLKALEALAVGNEASVRTLAAAALAKLAPARAAQLAPQALADRTSFDRLARQPDVDLTAALHAGAVQIHAQGIALPHLVARGDIAGLAAIAQAPKQPEAVRLGAIEALARMAREPAEAVLKTVATSATEEELRKAAWRGLRRSKRARQRGAEATAS
jgi:ParB family chromosome partitioning protein